MLQHFDILRKPTEMCSLRPVRHQWGASEATESSMSRTAWPTRSSQPARWSTNINRYQQISSGSTLEIFGMVLHATSICGCAKVSVCLHLNILNIWIEAAHLVESSALCNRHRRSISWDNFKIEAYAWFLQQNYLFAHWLPHAFVHFLRSTSTSMRGKHDNMTLSPVSSVCSHPTAWTITKQAGFLRRSHLLSDVHTTEGNSLQSIKVQLATAVEHQAIVAAKETLRAVIEPLSQNCVRKKKQAKYPCWSVRCSSMSVFSSSFIIFHHCCAISISSMVMCRLLTEWLRGCHFVFEILQFPPRNDSDRCRVGYVGRIARWPCSRTSTLCPNPVWVFSVTHCPTMENAYANLPIFGSCHVVSQNQVPSQVPHPCSRTSMSQQSGAIAIMALVTRLLAHEGEANGGFLLKIGQ